MKENLYRSKGLTRRFTTEGFTLIELMVVISIIGVLSSIVIVSVSTARSKARDALIRRNVKEITNALYLARDASATSQFPGTPNTRYCLGNTTGNNCFQAQAFGDTALGSTLAPYMASIPKPPNPPYNNGAIYAYNSYVYWPYAPANAVAAGVPAGTYLVWPQERTASTALCKGYYWPNVGGSNDGYSYCFQNIEANP